MSTEQESKAAESAMASQAGESATASLPPEAEDQAPPNEEQLRAAYEAELNRITAAEMIVQTAVSLINIGGRRLGLGQPGPSGEPLAGGERDLEQVRDAIDGASALMPILERRMPGELRPLRDAIAQLQVAYAREAQSSASANTSASASSASTSTSSAARPEPVKEPERPAAADQEPLPGPAQASGRLWVPGR